MTAAGPPNAEGGGDQVGLPFLRRQGAVEQRLAVLMAARLALALVSLGIALALDMAVGDLLPTQQRGLYGTVAFAFLATAIYGIMLPHVERRGRFAAVNIATDIAIVSSLVVFSGGAESVFSFLYVVVALYAALLFERRGALVTAGLGAMAYGGVLLAGELEIGGLVRSGSENPAGVIFTVWTIHSSAIGLVAALASFLAVELRRTGAALRHRTHELARLANLHQRTVESLMSGLLTADRSDRITSFNPEAERITGLRASDAIGRDVESVLPGARALVIGPADSGTTRPRARMAFRAERGEDLHLGIAAYVLRDVGGEPLGHVVIFQDVTDVVKMEDELRRSERLAAVGELSASIAHEIRNPLAALSGCIEILRSGEAGRGNRPDSGRLMDIVVRETDRLNRLITDFLEYARPGPLALESLELSTLLGEVLEMFESMPLEGIQLDVDVEEGLTVLGDAGQLRQVLWNLALNGAQAMPDGGELSIRARSCAEGPPQEASAEGRRPVGEKDDWIEIVVRDHGVGIPPETLEHIFDPFFTTKPEGSGLGLATVHRIVEEHGGSIGLESSKEGGTEVSIRLPRGDRES